MSDGWNEMCALAAENDESTVLVVNHSGGKDSMRMLGLLAAEFPDLPIVCVMADTGFEHRKPVSAAEWVRLRCAWFPNPVPFTVVRNERRTYLEMVEQRGMFPSAQCRQCTSDLKRGPIERFIRSLPYRCVINCLGIRAEESSNRSRMLPWQQNWNLTTAKRIVFNWFPIFSESEQTVLSWHWQTGVPLHPVYVPEFHRDGTAGGYLRRFSCRVCIFSSDRDLAAIAVHDPEAFEAISQLEARLGFTMRPGVSLVQIVERGRQMAEEDARQSLLCFPS